MSNPANQFLRSYSGQMGPNLPSGRTADPAYKRLSVGARNRGGQRVPSDQRKPGLGRETHRNDPDGDWLDMAYQRELGRNVDEQGAQYWRDQLEGGQSRDDVLRNIKSSNEYREFQARNNPDGHESSKAKQGRGIPTTPLQQGALGHPDGAMRPNTYSPTNQIN